MLTSIDVNSSSIVHVYRESLGDKGLFSSPNILQIAKKKTMYVFFEYSLNANSGPAILRIFLGSYPSASKSSRKPMHKVWLEWRRFFARSTIAPFADSWGLPDLICTIICSYTVLDIVNSKSHQHWQQVEHAGMVLSSCRRCVFSNEYNTSTRPGVALSSGLSKE